MIYNILLVIVWLGLVACFYMLARNNAIYRYRMAVLERSTEEYDRLPPYDTMLYRFWIWPLKVFWAKP